MCGADSGKLLRDRTLAHMPSGDVEVSREQAQQRIDIIMKSGLYQFVDAGHQNNVVGLRDALLAMASGTGPKIPLNASEVVQRNHILFKQKRINSTTENKKVD